MAPPPAGSFGALTASAAHVLTAAYLVTMMFGMGLALGGAEKEDKPTVRRRRRLLARALGLNLVLLPLVAVGVVRALGLTGDVAIAFVLLAACPGGRFAPHLTRMARGDLALSVEITLFLVKFVSLTAPVTLRLALGMHPVDLDELRIIAQVLVLQLLPFVAGKALRRRRGDLANRLERPLNLAALACAVLAVALMLVNRGLRTVLSLGPRGVLAILAFAATSASLGWLLGGTTAPTKKAFAISANARNMALALTLANLAFPDRNVHIATFAGWLVYSACDYAFALVAGRRAAQRPMGAPLPAR